MKTLKLRGLCDSQPQSYLLWSCAVQWNFLFVYFCLSAVPKASSIIMGYRNRGGFPQVSWTSAVYKDAFGELGLLTCHQRHWLQECLVFGRRRSLPWEFLVFFLVFFFLAWYPSASQWGLIDWECHLQSLSILPPTAPPGFPCYIVLHSGCSSIKHGQDPELSSQEMCAHYQPSYQHQNPVNHSDLQGPLASLVNKGPMSAMALHSFFFLSELSNYSVVYANTEGALGASSGLCFY